MGPLQNLVSVPFVRVRSAKLKEFNRESTPIDAKFGRRPKRDAVAFRNLPKGSEGLQDRWRLRGRIQRLLSSARKCEQRTGGFRHLTEALIRIKMSMSVPAA